MTYLGGVKETATNAVSGELVIPSVVQGSEVTMVALAGFKNNTLLTKVVLPKTLQTIGEFAFKGCSALKSVVIPEGVRTILGSAFALSGLEEIELPASLTTLGPYAFEGCSSLKLIRFRGAMPPNILSGLNYFTGLPSDVATYVPDPVAYKDFLGKVGLSVSRVHPYVEVSGIKLRTGDEVWTTTLGSGETKELVALLEPETATEQGVTWSSSDRKLVGVLPDADVPLKARLNAVGAGEAKVTVTSTNGGFAAICSVTVAPWVGTLKVVGPSGTLITPSSVELPVVDGLYEPNGAKLTLKTLTPTMTVKAAGYLDYKGAGVVSDNVLAVTMTPDGSTPSSTATFNPAEMHV